MSGIVSGASLGVMPMKTRRVFDSIEAMLAPEALSAVVGARVERVTRKPFGVEHRSANTLYEVWLEDAGERRRLILKVFEQERDWVMRLTHDTRTREAMLFVEGVYARMPKEIYVPVIAAARTGQSWATLMQDVSSVLPGVDRVLSDADARDLLEALAALHAHFWEDGALQDSTLQASVLDDSVLDDSELGLSSLEDFLMVLSPARVGAELEAGRTHPVLELAARGWRGFFEDAPRDVGRVIREMQEDPRALMAALEGMPQTLVHGDYKLGNLGVGRGGEPHRNLHFGKGRGQGLEERRWKAVVLDWQDAARGTGAMDLGYFLALNARWLPFDRKEAMDVYADALAARGHTQSRGALELGMLAGGPLRLFWLMQLQGPKELDWWYDLVRRCV
jgi:hypothetical protein